MNSAAYQVLKNYLLAKKQSDDASRALKEARKAVFDVLGEEKQKGVENDLKFNIYPNYSWQVNMGNFARENPQLFQRKKDLEEKIKDLQKELKAIDAVVDNYKYRDVKAGPSSWTLKVDQT